MKENKEEMLESKKELSKLRKYVVEEFLWDDEIIEFESETIMERQLFKEETVEDESMNP